MHTVPRVWTIT
ncbi:hypothetical protein AZE42_03746, partial [Rhizopogon vesiculosus]